MIKLEIWKDVIGYEGIYQVSNTGRVKRIGEYTNQYGSIGKCERILKPGKKDNGYLFYNLSVENHTKIKYAHRAVAEAFIPNPLNKPTVNHIDGDRTNNAVENLEWNTYLENNIHSIDVLHKGEHNRRNRSDLKPVIQFDINMNIVKEYPSMREAQRQTGVLGIDKVCNRSRYRKTAGGYIWIYKDDYNKSVETIETTSLDGRE